MIERVYAFADRMVAVAQREAAAASIERARLAAESEPAFARRRAQRDAACAVRRKREVEQVRDLAAAAVEHAHREGTLVDLDARRSFGTVERERHAAALRVQRARRFAPRPMIQRARRFAPCVHCERLGVRRAPRLAAERVGGIWRQRPSGRGAHAHGAIARDLDSRHRFAEIEIHAAALDRVPAQELRDRCERGTSGTAEHARILAARRNP